MKKFNNILNTITTVLNIVEILVEAGKKVVALKRA